MTATALRGSIPSGAATGGVSVLLISELHYHALRLQELLTNMGSGVMLAPTVEVGLSGIGLLHNDLVIVDADLGYPAVEALAQRLREQHRERSLAIMVGWWDERAAEMQAFSHRIIRKPVRAWQVQETFTK